jgi:chemotaxis protein methyltransferase CheR
VHNLAAFDLIVCRNVLIYFNLEMIRECVGRFWSSLVEGGWLLVGHAEMNAECFRAFRVASLPGTLAFERVAQHAAQPEPSLGLAGPEPAAAWQLPALPELPPLPALAPLPAPASAAVAIAADERIVRIRAHADCAQWAEAAALCRRMIEQDNLDPRGHFYHALVLEQTGQALEAERALGRAIYLDREFVLAHYHRGLLLQKGVDLAGAARAFRNVLNLLRAQDPRRRFAEADGITAADLAELARMQLEILEPA